MRLRVTRSAITSATQQQSEAPPVVPTGAITAMSIMDATTLDASAGIGVDGSGWAARVVLKDITSTAGTCDATKLVLQVSDPGYATDGSVTVVTRTIRGTAPLRRRSPNGNSKQISTDGEDLTIHVALSDWIFAGTTIVSASIESGFYPGSVASSAGGSGITNASTIAYIKPSFAWVNPQWDMSGSTLPVEALAYHPYGRAGQQVACVELTATDGTNSGSLSRVAVPTLSTQITQGFPPEVWAASVDCSNLTNGASCTVNAVVKPWLGDSSAILNLSSDGVAWPTHLPKTRLNFVCDRTGAYAGGFAYVQVGATGGAVSAVAATAAASPFPTINAALTALRTWIGANKGHTDLGGGTVRLMDAAGMAITHTITAGLTTTWGGAALCTIERDPAASAVVSVTWTTTALYPSRIRWRNVRIAPSAGSYNIVGPNTAGSSVVIDGCTFDSSFSPSARAIYYYEYRHLINPIFEGTNPILLLPLPDTSGPAASVTFMCGATMTGTAAVPNPSTRGPMVMAGCNLPYFDAFIALSSAFTPGLHGLMWVNNRTRRLDQAMTYAGASIGSLPTVLQCLTESQSDSVTGLNLFADGDLTSYPGFRYDAYNGAYGARSNRDYNDTAASNFAPSGLIKRSISVASVVMDINWKGDTFPDGAPVGGCGSWGPGYRVGMRSFVSLLGAHSKASTDVPHNDNAAQPFLGMAWPAGNVPNAQALGLTPTQLMDGFTNYTAYPRAVPALGGNYKPLSSATWLHGLIPAGMQGLKYDLLGQLRRNDGTGAAGPIES
jgi:hypothetical protein